MTGPPTEANPNGSEGWHVLEIFVARDNNPTGEYVFLRHFRHLQHGSARNWAPFLVGELDRESRESLAAYCSDQDPTRVGSSQGSNCITCVVNSIRALYITNDEHERRVRLSCCFVRSSAIELTLLAYQLDVARTIPHDPVNDYNHHDHFDNTTAEQAIADAYNYTGNGGASTSRSTQRPSA